MQLGQCLGQWQAETGALILARMGVVDLPERLERERHIIGVHADASIANLKGDPIAARPGGGDRHRATTRRELDTVRQEIEQNLLQFC